jgi:hypothetical protein
MRFDMPIERKMRGQPHSQASPIVSSEVSTGFLKNLGPGLVTGAADDDPSGIATYSQVGAQFGYGLAWTMLFVFEKTSRPRLFIGLYVS